jgi:hypothetical protein
LLHIVGALDSVNVGVACAILEDEKGLSGRIRSTGIPIVVPDIAEEPEFLRECKDYISLPVDLFPTREGCSRRQSRREGMSMKHRHRAIRTVPVLFLFTVSYGGAKWQQ